MTDVVFGKTYEDKRTHRSGVLISYSDKYKTYLMESSDGKSFNVTSSQFKVNWRLIESAEVKEEVKPKIEPAKVKSGTTYKGPTEEQKKELDNTFAEAVLLGQKFISSFENDALALKVVPTKNMFRLRIGYNIVTDIYIMVKFHKIRVWFNEIDCNSFLASSSIKPISTKQYPYSGRCYAVEFDVADLNAVLEDLRVIVLDNLVKLKGGK